MESVILLFVDVDDTSDHKLLQAQIDNYLGRDTVSVEAVVVESIKSDVLQVSTPPPLTAFTTIFVTNICTFVNWIKYIYYC